jgi:hypothetical protein
VNSNGAKREVVSNGILRVAALAILILASAGCQSNRLTQPPRAVTEQLVLSTAADRAIVKLNLDSLRDRKVYLEERYFKAYDQEYALGAIRQHLSDNGVRLMQYESDADVIVEVRSGALSADSQESLLGLPALQVPIPFAGSVTTPEIAIYKSERSTSIAKVGLFAYERLSGQHVHSSDVPNGKAYFKNFKLLGFITWRRTDVPELLEKDKKQK